MDPQEDKSTWRTAAARLGFLADSYDLFAIDIVILVLDYVYGKTLFDAVAKGYMVSAMIIGVIVGQLTFGYVADLVGRRWTFVSTAALTVLGAIASACAFSSSHVSLPVQLAICRFILGLGVGGEYPLSASVVAEAAGDTETRRYLLASVVAMQGFGMLLCSCVALLVTSSGCSLDWAWRIMLGFGAVPSLIAFFIRCQLPESEEFKQAKQSRAENPGNSTSLRSLRLPLLGTSFPWFLMNIYQYSIGSFKSSILEEVFPQRERTLTNEVFHQAAFSAIISIFAIVGFGIGMWLLSRHECAQIQLSGFSALVVVFSTTTVLLQTSRTVGAALVPLLGLMFFFNNLGPNLTTFILPAETFPTLLRATCHGISAACGKMGAVLGSAAFAPLKESVGITGVFVGCGIIALVGALATSAFTPTVANQEMIRISKGYGSLF
mmetsp:Transcript_36784/g.58923  ORF Transcript_36784/g.58923 Transcript_36784/m.58923 type:complete len:436 (-) Transcript_36784:108-1415(-)